MKSEKRLEYYDIAKFIAIAAVIYGHCIQHYLDQNPLYNPVYLFIYSFHMPLFMIISGYFSSRSLSLDFITFIKKKSVQLLLPYFSWQIISITLKSIIGDVDIESIIRYDFWFLVSLYICSILAWCFHHLDRSYKGLFLIVSLVITHVSLFRLKDMYPCFLIGMLLYSKDDFIQRYKGWLCLLSLILYTMLACFTLNENFFDVSISFGGLIKQLNVIVVGVCASFFIIRMCGFIENYIPSTIKKVGQQTLVIYLIQSILFTLTKDVISLSGVSPLILYLVVFPSIVVVFTAVSMLVISLINRNRNLSLILLGKKI